MVSVLKPSTSPASPMVPSRSSEPRISQLSPAVSALDVSQVCLLSWSSTQFQAENTPIPSARISTRKMERTIRRREVFFLARKPSLERMEQIGAPWRRRMTPGTAALDWPCGYVLERRTPEMMKGFFLSRSLPVPAGWKLCGTEEEGRAVRLAGFTDVHGQNVSPVRNSLAGSVRFASGRNPWTGMVFLRPDDGMKLGGTLVGSFAPLPSLMVPPKRFVPASYVERGRDCVVYVSSLPERHIRSH